MNDPGDATCVEWANMSIVFDTWWFIAAALGVVWFVRLLSIARAARTRCVLDDRSEGIDSVDAPAVSIVVAAKDEEANIERCVTTLLAQDYPDFEVIVVDDRSADRTPEILQRLRERSTDRFRVIRVQALRDGWFGKNNAMREGIAASRGDWLMFSDADCRFTSTRTLSIAMGEAHRRDADLLSITPVLETPTVWERVVQPVCAFVLMLWFRPERVNDPTRNAAYANGAFMLMRRRCYDAVGGHERVRAELNEDIQLARIVKREGYNLRVAENDGLFQTRMYDSLGAAWCGWSRIFYGSLNTFRRLAVSMLMVAVYTLVPWISLLVALIGWAGASGATAASWRAFAFAWAGIILLQQAFLWRFYSIVKVAPAWSLTYPLGAVAALGMLASALLKVFGATGTTWRGTTYAARRSRGDAASIPTSASRAAAEVYPQPVGGGAAPQTTASARSADPVG